jgi:hypothetical protein
MAKQIIILETTPGNGGDVNVRAAFWFPVVEEKSRLPLPNLSQSVWSGASAEDLTSLQAGAVIEEVFSKSFPSTFTVEGVQMSLEAHYASRLAFLSQVPFKGELYGLRLEDGAWSTK